MSARKQVPKSGFRPQFRFNPRKLEHELRKQWRREHPVDQTHYDNAQQYFLEEFVPRHNIEETSVVYRAGLRYFEVRKEITDKHLQQLQKATPAQAAAAIVEAELAPGIAVDLDQTLEVYRGIHLAQIALKRTIEFDR